MKSCIPNPCLTITLSLMLLIMSLCQSAWAGNVSLVSWGPSYDYVTANQNTQRTSSNGEIPFSLATPITPASGYYGVPIYGGIKTNGVGGLNFGAKVNQNDPYNGGGFDTFVFGRTATNSQPGDKISGVFVWERKDFLALSDPVTGPLEISRLGFRGRSNGAATGGQARFVVRDMDGYYMISDDLGLLTYYTATTTYLNDLSNVNWYAYNPSDVDTIGSQISNPRFDEIEAVGLYLTVTNTGSGFLYLAFSSFIAEGNSEPLVFCFYPTYRQASNLPVSSVAWSKATHIVHSFAMADDNLNLAAATSWLPNQGLVDQAHANGVKVLLALGGGGNSANFNAMADDWVVRGAFVDAVADWVATYGYDGVVLDWEFPTAGQAQKVVNFVYSLRMALPTGSEIGVAVGPNAYTGAGYVASQKPTGDQSTTLDELIDYLMVMSYDYHGAWNYAGFNAPLFAVEGVGDDFSFEQTYNLWTQTKGFSASKVIMGLPFYGRVFTGYTGFGNSVSTSYGITYMNVLDYIATGQWSLYVDTTQGVTDIGVYESHALPFMVKANEMISYENPASIASKVRWFRGKGLPGYMIWEIGQDYDGTTNLLLDAARAVW